MSELQNAIAPTPQKSAIWEASAMYAPLGKSPLGALHALSEQHCNQGGLSGPRQLAMAPREVCHHMD